ncbi:MAG: hypothetical protein V1818_01580 [Candidatus Aenigmatarchaeota archaeon]
MSVYLGYVVSMVAISAIGGACAYLSEREVKKEIKNIKYNAQVSEIEEYNEIPA